MGHNVLSSFGQLLKKRFRVEDIRARWGGEEFIIVFKHEVKRTMQGALAPCLKNSNVCSSKRRMVCNSTLLAVLESQAFLMTETIYNTYCALLMSAFIWLNLQDVIESSSVQLQKHQQNNRNGKNPDCR